MFHSFFNLEIFSPLRKSTSSYRTTRISFHWLFTMFRAGPSSACYSMMRRRWYVHHPSLPILPYITSHTYRIGSLSRRESLFWGFLWGKPKGWITLVTLDVWKKWAAFKCIFMHSFIHSVNKQPMAFYNTWKLSFSNNQLCQPQLALIIN